MLSSKVEIDVFQKTDIQPVINLVMKHDISAIVTHPDLMQDCMGFRDRYRLGVKIYSIIDWPKGENSATTKFRFINSNALYADGFEIMLGETDTLDKDINQCLSFVRHNIGQDKKVRFVLNCYDFERYKPPYDYLHKMANLFLDCGIPSCVRINAETKFPSTKVNAAYFNTVMQEFRSIINVPMKASGNASYAMASECKYDKYAVNLKQIESFIEELSKPV